MVLKGQLIELLKFKPGLLLQILLQTLPLKKLGLHADYPAFDPPSALAPCLKQGKLLCPLSLNKEQTTYY